MRHLFKLAIGLTCIQIVYFMVYGNSEITIVKDHFCNIDICLSLLFLFKVPSFSKSFPGLCYYLYTYFFFGLIPINCHLPRSYRHFLKHHDRIFQYFFCTNWHNPCFEEFVKISGSRSNVHAILNVRWWN